LKLGRNIGHCWLNYSLLIKLQYISLLFYHFTFQKTKSQLWKEPNVKWRPPIFLASYSNIYISNKWRKPESTITMETWKVNLEEGLSRNRWDHWILRFRWVTRRAEHLATTLCWAFGVRNMDMTLSLWSSI
jgi:hypothetical protein